MSVLMLLERWLKLLALKQTLKHVMNKNFLKLIDNEDDVKWNILLIAVLVIWLVSALFSNWKTDKKSLAIIQRVLRLYFTRKLFSDTNFGKNYEQKFNLDTEDFIKSILKLSRRQKTAITKFLTQLH